MNIKTQSLFLALLFLISFQPCIAGVTVDVGGPSNGDNLFGFNGPAGINRLAKTKDSGGSIQRANAKGIFTRTMVTLGNRVIANKTSGDQDFTHVDANSLFVGIGTFKSNDGNPVPDFTIDLAVRGNLQCKTPDPNVPEFFSIANVGVELVVDNQTKFVGSATQDGTGSFATTGNLTGQFTTSPNKAAIRKKFPINLGTLSDGQRLLFIFQGSTLVSFGEDVPIDFCTADFFRTDSFQPAKKQQGTLDIKGAKNINVSVVDDDPNIVSGNEKLIIEDSDAGFLNSIEENSVRVLIPVNELELVFPGSNSGTFDVDLGSVGDLNGNNIFDREVVFSGGSSTLPSILFGGQTINTIYVTGLTTSGDAFFGTLKLTEQ